MFLLQITWRFSGDLPLNSSLPSLQTDFESMTEKERKSGEREFSHWFFKLWSSLESVWVETVEKKRSQKDVMFQHRLLLPFSPATLVIIVVATLPGLVQTLPHPPNISWPKIQGKANYINLSSSTVIAVLSYTSSLVQSFYPTTLQMPATLNVAFP